MSVLLSHVQLAYDQPHRNNNPHSSCPLPGVYSVCLNKPLIHHPMLDLHHLIFPCLHFCCNTPMASPRSTQNQATCCALHLAYMGAVGDKYTCCRFWLYNTSPAKANTAKFYFSLCLSVSQAPLAVVVSSRQHSSQARNAGMRTPANRHHALLSLLISFDEIQLLAHQLLSLISAPSGPPSAPSIVSEL